MSLIISHHCCVLVDFSLIIHIYFRFFPVFLHAISFSVFSSLFLLKSPPLSTFLPLSPPTLSFLLLLPLFLFMSYIPSRVSHSSSVFSPRLACLPSVFFFYLIESPPYSISSPSLLASLPTLLRSLRFQVVFVSRLLLAASSCRSM